MHKLAAIADYLRSPDTTLVEVLDFFNVAPHQLVLVVDEDKRLLGTVTDGDVRRAILSGAALNEPVSTGMHENPVVGRVSDPDAHVSLMGDLPFLPLLDDAFRVDSVLIPVDLKADIEEAVIMAGGLGTRMGSLTADTPKPLLPVAGRPILDHIMSNLEAAQVSRVWISVNHLADRIESFISSRTNKIEVRFLRESQKLGTAGALGLLPHTPPSPLLVLNGDVLTNTDFTALTLFHDRRKHDSTIAVASHHVKVPFGVVEHDNQGLMTKVDEKPVLRQFIAAGIYYLSPETISLVPKNCFMNMPEVLNEATNIGLRVGIFPIHEYWADIGNPDDLDNARTDPANAQ